MTEKVDKSTQIDDNERPSLGVEIDEYLTYTFQANSNLNIQLVVYNEDEYFPKKKIYAERKNIYLGTILGRVYIIDGRFRHNFGTI